MSEPRTQRIFERSKRFLLTPLTPVEDSLHARLCEPLSLLPLILLCSRLVQDTLQRRHR